jgi:hypothetical protein
MHGHRECLGASLRCRSGAQLPLAPPEPYSGAWSTKGDGDVQPPCPLSLAPGTPWCSVGKCAQPTQVTLESEGSGSLSRLHILPALGSFDHGVGHPLLLLYDANAPHYRNNKAFKVLGHSA